MNTHTSELTWDERFEILSSDRRRRLVFYLVDQNGEGDLTELARRIAAWENDIEPSEVSERERKRVYISLYQTHIPKLEEYGLIEYDREETRVFATDRLEEVTRLVSHHTPGSGTDHAWQRYYPGIATMGVVLLATIPFDFPYLTPTTIATVTVGSLLVVSFTHYYFDRSPDG